MQLALLAAPQKTESSMMCKILNFKVGNVPAKSLLLLILVKILNFVFFAYKQGLSSLALENKWDNAYKIEKYHWNSFCVALSWLLLEDGKQPNL